MNEYLHGLWTLSLPPAKIKQFEKKGISTVDDLLMFLPRRYKYFGIPGAVHEGSCAFIMELHHVEERITSKGMEMLIASGISSGKKVSVVWFRQNYRYESIRRMCNNEVLVAGNVSYDNEWNQYNVMAADVFTSDFEDDKEIVLPVYSKITGMSDEYLTAAIKKATDNFLQFGTSDVPKAIQAALGLCDMEKAIYEMHFPATRKSQEEAARRLRMEKMYFFLMMMKKQGENVKEKSPYRIKKHTTFLRLLESLPYELTADQEKTVKDIRTRMAHGDAVNALIQGDVGCGKSIVAFLVMASMAENGYQSVMLAPTSVLAEQHFSDLKRLVEPHGIKVAFVPPLTTLKKKAREDVLKSIRSGEAQIIVGTHAILSDAIEFKELGLIIADEEHKFGVEQRKRLMSKTSEGVHYIKMSATPIPRSLASVIYGNRVQLYLIQSMPAGRVPVKTAISCGYRVCFEFIEKQIAANRQVYVVCPQIDPNENMEGVASVTELSEKYAQRFGSDRVCTLTGKNSKKDTAQILADFKENKKPILIATTVIEVGVNVPNANTIIIHNAERFGLAGLHQLRGRVGRGGGDAYCILFSKERENERLKAMCRTNNGFEIAEEDMRLRGAGDLFGTAQSGLNEYIELVISHSDEYKALKAQVEKFFK